VPIPEFSDPRQVAIYDAVNAYEPRTQPDFYVNLAEEIGAERVIDLGCGTGIVTLQLADKGFHAIGVDPSPLMLDAARRKPGANRVEWIEGGPEQLLPLDADLAIMSGHVAQFFVAETAWREALNRLKNALKAGGHLAFESRNPSVREWESWSAASARTVEHPAYGPIECWTEVTGVGGDVVSAVGHRRFAATGEELVSPFALRFRSEEELTTSLTGAGFAVEGIFGDWDRRPPGPNERELIVVARSEP
jgi:SAM-dependent methyltransferase